MRWTILPLAGLLLVPAPGYAADVTDTGLEFAQSAPTRPATPPATTQRTDEKTFLVFFDWDKSTLTNEARRIIADAAAEYKRLGATRIVATGHTDLSGSAQHNMRLSVRRADAVKAELIRQGVPANIITTVGRGEEDPLVPTKDGVREPQNRRVLIEIPVTKPPAAAAPAPAPTPAAAPPPPPPPLKWAVTLGPWYGYNIKETDHSDKTKSSNLLGPDLRVEYAITPNWMVMVEGTLFNTLGTSVNDGWGGRTVAGFHHQWNLGAWHPFIGPHGGYIWGSGVEDGFLLGPEVGVNFDLSRNLFLYARVAYDHDFRNEITQGIANGSLGAGYRF